MTSFYSGRYLRLIPGLLLSLLTLWTNVALPQDAATGQDKPAAEAGAVEVKPVEQNLISVESRPSGAIVRINGAYSFVGRTPFVVPYPLQGRYRVSASRQGYEKETSYVDFLANEQSSIVVRLTPKTRLKAGLRSMVFPGWGQFYSGERLRGFLFSAAQVALVVRTAFAINNYNDSKNNLDRAVDVFNTSLDEASFQDAQNRLTTAKNDKDFRDTMLLVTAGFWALNVLDSIIFFSRSSDGIVLSTKSPLSQNYDGNNQVMLTWKIGL